jgi:hypothetical protein
MNVERLFKIVTMSLTTDSLKLEQELERVINSDLNITEKTETIKTLLSKIVTTEASTAKFLTMMTNTNNTHTNQSQDGK